MEKHHISHEKYDVCSTSLVVINSEEQHWILQEWIPAAHRVGLNFFAAVMPLSNLGRSVIENMELSVSHDFLTYKLIEEEYSAIQWLTEQPNS